MATLTHDEARAFYDRFGRKQDRQGFYEDRAIDALVAHGDFATARRVCEFGCGTGRLAERLLAHHLPAHAHYLGLDISAGMCRLASDRLQRWRARAAIVQTDGAPVIPTADDAFDRYVTTYTLDLLSHDDIRALIADAGRVLAAGGLLCHAGLAPGRGLVSKVVSRVWAGVHALRPALVGGCRPLEAGPFFENDTWRIRHHVVVSAFAITSEIVIAERMN